MDGADDFAENRELDNAFLTGRLRNALIMSSCSNPMIASFVFLASLADPPSVSAMTPAAIWVRDVLVGPLATGIAVIAVAWIGFAMLAGRIDIRRGLSVVLGCFLLFGARGIVDGLRSLSTNDGAQTFATAAPPPAVAKAPPPVNTSNAFDPYAGAAVTRNPR
jgi:type IV secretion system protein VirB2